jgi:hypothetical protein
MSLVGPRPYSAGRINGNALRLNHQIVGTATGYLPREFVRDHEDGIRRFSVHGLEHSVESSRSEEECFIEKANTTCPRHPVRERSDAIRTAPT